MRAAAVGLSVVLHGALLFGLSVLPDRRPEAAPKLVELTVVKAKPPPPPPVVEEVKKEPERPPPEVRPKLVRQKTVPKVVADEPKPEPKAPPKEPEKPVIPPGGFSVDMSATVQSGGVAVPAIEGGGNMFADPNDRTKPPGEKRAEPPPKETGKGKGKAPAGTYQITRRPEFVGDERDRTPPYPEAAKAQEIEGQVVLEVYVGTSGKVEDIRILKRLFPACDEAAVKTAREKFRFKPAMAGDEPVGMWLTIPVSFILER